MYKVWDRKYTYINNYTVKRFKEYYVNTIGPFVLEWIKTIPSLYSLQILRQLNINAEEHLSFKCVLYEGRNFDYFSKSNS